jgi:hypothetical protein
MRRAWMSAKVASSREPGLALSRRVFHPLISSFSRLVDSIKTGSGLSGGVALTRDWDQTVHDALDDEAANELDRELLDATGPKRKRGTGRGRGVGCPKLSWASADTDSLVIRFSSHVASPNSRPKSRLFSDGATSNTSGATTSRPSTRIRKSSCASPRSQSPGPHSQRVTGNLRTMKRRYSAR